MTQAKAFQVTLYFVDTNGMSDADIIDAVDDARFPNRCIAPSVIEAKSVDVGEWSDDHPLNKSKSVNDLTDLFIDDEVRALRAEVAALGLLLSEQSEELRGAWSSINESRETEDALRAEVARLNLEVARRVLSHLDAYQVDAARTLTPDAELSILALGLCGESGELVDHIKKHLGHGHDLDRDYVEKEIGDVLWYLAAIATKLGISLWSAADKNIEKLRRRYPEGFSHEASRNRDDDEVTS